MLWSKKIYRNRKSMVVCSKCWLAKLSFALVLTGLLNSSLASYSEAQMLVFGDVFSTNSPFAGMDPLRGKAEIMPPMIQGGRRQCIPPDPTWRLVSQKNGECYYFAPFKRPLQGRVTNINEAGNLEQKGWRCGADEFDQSKAVCTPPMGSPLPSSPDIPTGPSGSGAPGRPGLPPGSVYPRERGIPGPDRANIPPPSRSALPGCQNLEVALQRIFPFRACAQRQDQWQGVLISRDWYLQGCSTNPAPQDRLTLINVDAALDTIGKLLNLCGQPAIAAPSGSKPVVGGIQEDNCDWNQWQAAWNQKIRRILMIDLYIPKTATYWCRIRFRVNRDGSVVSTIDSNSFTNRRTYNGDICQKISDNVTNASELGWPTCSKRDWVELDDVFSPGSKTTPGFTPGRLIPNEN